MKDILHRNISVGDYVAYGLRGNSGALAVYEISSVTDKNAKGIKVWKDADFHSNVEVALIGGGTAKRKYCKYAYNLKDSSSGYTLNTPLVHKAKNKVVTLAFSDRMLLLNKQDITESLLKHEE